MLQGTLIEDLIHTVERVQEAATEPEFHLVDTHGPMVVYETQPAQAALLGVA